MGYRQRTTIRLLGDRPKSRYVVTPKALLLDERLTSDARLVGIYLLSLSDGWEVNQAQIAKALSMGTNKRRVGNAMKNLVEHGWLRHNEYKSGERVFKHEYVMHRSRVFHGESNSTDSVPLYGTTAVPPPKYQSKRTGGDSTEVPTGTPAASGREDSWTAGFSYCAHCYALTQEEPHGEDCPLG